MGEQVIFKKEFDTTKNKVRTSYKWKIMSNNNIQFLSAKENRKESESKLFTVLEVHRTKLYGRLN